MLSEEDERRYAAALERNGFFGPCSWYMNWKANLAYAERAKAHWRLEMPVLFLHAEYDYICETIVSRARRADARPLRQPDRSDDRLRPLDGAGKAGRGQCGAGEMGWPRSFPRYGRVGGRARERPRLSAYLYPCSIRA